MPSTGYVPANTFTTGAIEASKLQENLTGIDKYISGGISTLDLQTSPTGWVETQHVMRGTYQPLINQHEFTTGLVAGGNEDVVSHLNNTVATFNSDSFQVAPRTCIEFYLEQSGYVIFSYSLNPISLSDNTTDTHSGDVFGLFIMDNIENTNHVLADVSSTKNQGQEEVDFGDQDMPGGSTYETPEAPSWERRQCFQGFHIWTAPHTGTYKIMLDGGSNTSQVALTHYVWSLEVHYI